MLCALSHQKAQVPHQDQGAFTHHCLPEELPESHPQCFCDVFRKRHSLDLTLHLWRLPLHSPGECGARPARGVQLKVCAEALMFVSGVHVGD